MSRGILETIGFMTTVVFAVPLTIAGLDLFRRGNLVVGTGLLGAAAAMILVNEYVTRPSDLPTMIAGRVVGTLVGETSEEDES